MKNNNLDKYFKKVLGKNHNHNKTEKIQEIINEEEITVHNTIMVTDTVGDVLEARKANIKSIGVTWGCHTKEKFEKINTDVIVDKINDLEKSVQYLI